jgi:hypothetical protein
VTDDADVLREAHEALERLCNKPTLLPVRPLVIDSDVLMRNIVREARPDKPPTKLLVQARIGTIRPYISSHQMGEVRKHIARVAADSGVDPARAKRIFEQQYVPLLWQVDFVSTASRDALAAAVFQVDAADGAIAQLGVLLGVRVVTANKRHFRGVAIEDEWFTVVSAYASVGLFDGANASAVVSVRITGHGVAGASRAVQNGYGYLAEHPRVALAAAAIVAILLVAAAIYLCDAERRRAAQDLIARVGPRVKEGAGRLLRAYLDLADAAFEAEAVIIASKLPRAELTLEQRLAEVLGSARFPVPTETLVDGVSMRARRLIERTLRANPAFVFQEQGWTLGTRARLLSRQFG